MLSPSNNIASFHLREPRLGTYRLDPSMESKLANAHLMSKVYILSELDIELLALSNLLKFNIQ